MKMLAARFKSEQRAPLLLDKNIVSETRQVRANEGVTSFLEGAEESRLFISALSVGGLFKGVELKRRSDPEAAEQLHAWMKGIEGSLADRILPVDCCVALCWGELSVDRTRPVVDTLIAATALVHGLTLVTLNADDFRGIDIAVLNPWEMSRESGASDRT